MKKILQFSVAASMGGHTQYILNHWDQIDKERFRFDFLTFDSELSFEKKLEAQGCNVYHLPCYPQQDVDRFYKAMGEILKNDYDAVHLHTRDWSGFELEEIVQHYCVPQVIIHAHSSGYGRAANREEKIQGQLKHYEMRKRLHVNMATDFLACSEVAAEWLYGEQIPRDRIKIMHNAIDTCKFIFSWEEREKQRKKLGVDGKFVLGSVGRLELVKNHEFMIDVFHEVVKENPESILLLVGDGRQKEQIEAQIKSLDLQEHVKMLGKREDVNLILQAMDVFLLPSLFEGFPIALVEAQTSGLPCIVSDTVTKEETITDLVHYKPLIIEEWVDSIRHLKKHGERKSMHTEVSQAGYDMKTQVKELERVYERRLL